MMKSVKKFMKAKETPRGWLILGFVLTFVLTTGSTYLLQNMGRSDDNKAQNVQLLIDSMAQFQVCAAAFASEINEKGVATQDTRQNLIKNLNEQFAKIRVVEQMVDKEKLPSLEKYKAAILNMRGAVDKTSGVNAMKDFWSSASNLLAERNQISRELQSAI